MIGIEAFTAILTAIMVGVMLGIFKGFDWYLKRRGNDKKPDAAPVHWTDLTGEQRPITHTECKEQHVGLAEELRRGSDKMAAQTDSMIAIKETVLELKGDMRTGFAEVKTHVAEVVGESMGKHEHGPLHRSSRSSAGSYRKP